MLWKIFSVGPDEDRSNLLKACLSQQNTILLVRKPSDSYTDFILYSVIYYLQNVIIMYKCLDIKCNMLMFYVVEKSTLMCFTLTPTTNSSQMVIFQPVLQVYPIRHSWIITTHVSLGNLECHWKLFTRQLIRMQQFLRSLDQHPSAPTQLLATLQLELSNIQDIYKSSKTTITSAIQLLNSNQLQTRA